MLYTWRIPGASLAHTWRIYLAHTWRIYLAHIPAHTRRILCAYPKRVRISLKGGSIQNVAGAQDVPGAYPAHTPNIVEGSCRSHWAILRWRIPLAHIPMLLDTGNKNFSLEEIKSTQRAGRTLARANADPIFLRIFFSYIPGAYPGA